MGQSPSSSDGGAGAGAAVERKTSYYTLLGVDRSATDDEIKKAYRRKALALHPDRNYGNEAEATQTFAEVQSAYEVLADAQERAWYDSHESAILRGGDRPGDGSRSAPVYRGVKLTSADELAAIIGKFNRNVEFSDAPSGFFGFLRDTFEHLAREEEAAGDGEGAGPREHPTFGHQDDHDADVVRRFYAAWSGFTTVKSFSWCDQHRVSEAPDRFTRRRMEQENAKCRKDARSEFNEAVRSLVRLVKKRDPRVVPNTRSEEERQKALRDAAAAQRQRAREANAAKMGAVPEWSQARHDEEDELPGTFSESEGEGEVFRCVACHKMFKSEKQMHAHERSKKHQKATQELHRRMRQQNAHLGLDEEEPALGSGAVTPQGDGDGEADVPSDDVAAASDDHDAAGSCAEEEADDDEPASPRPPTHTTRDETQPPDATPHEPTTTQPAAETRPSESEDDDDDGESASRATIAARLQSPVRASPAPAHDACGNGSSSSEPATAPKSGKAAQKRARKAAAAAAAAAAACGAEAGGHHCHGCDAAFASQTKLFDHLTSQPTHARPQPVAAGRAPGRQAGKKKRS